MSKRLLLLFVSCILVLTATAQSATRAVTPASTTGGDSYCYKLYPGWQLVGITMNLDAASKAALLQQKAYVFDAEKNAYMLADESLAEKIAMGSAIWLHSDSDAETDLTVTGTIPVVQTQILMRQELDNMDFGEVTYAIGHKSPDTDTVTSAILCADLYQSLGKNVEARVSGTINSETKWVLEKFGVAVPATMTDATGKTMILVDHSAYAQAIDGMDQATILAMFDHHGLGDIISASPLLINTKPVGSTATIFYSAYLEYGVEIKPSCAGLIVAAILSDTNNMTTTTTTDMDRMAVEKLQKVAGIEDLEAFYDKLVEASCDYGGKTDYEIFVSDYKEVPMTNGQYWGIGEVNAWDTTKATDLATRMVTVMGKEETQTSLDQDFGEQDRLHLYTLVKELKNETSQLVYAGEGIETVVRKAFGDDFVDNGCKFDHIAVRKSEIVPQLYQAYCELYPPTTTEE